MNEEFNIHAARRSENIRLTTLLEASAVQRETDLNALLRAAAARGGAMSGGRLKQEVEIIVTATETVVNTVIAYRKELAATAPDLLLEHPHLKEFHATLDHLADGVLIAVQQRHATTAQQFQAGTLNAVLGEATRRVKILKNKISNEIQAMALEGALGMHRKNQSQQLTNELHGPVGNIVAEQMPPIIPVPSADKRCVFVVHGRNEAANNALFAFLRSIDLDPIEWEEAIALTGHGSPYPGQALEVAFSRAQAAVVLLTGDDLARLGRRFLKPSDKDYERDLTPQCRPNVLFEAGMAFGKHPERTIVVALGETRPFSDILGRHIVDLTSPTWRHELADRLRNAKCEVKTENRRKWLAEGNFDAANSHPDLTNTPSPANPDIGATPTKINVSDLYYPRISDDVKEQLQGAGQPPNPLLADGGAEYMISSPDDFTVRIVREEKTAIGSHPQYRQ